MKKLLLSIISLCMMIGLSACGDGGLFCKHEYSVEVKESTCLELGEKTKTCNLCGKIKVTSIAKKSHEFSIWKETVKRSCTEDGVKTRVCSLCETVETETSEKLGHSFGEFKTVIEASEIQNGLMRKKCSRCGLTEDRVVQSLNYNDTTLFLVDYDTNAANPVSSEKDLFDITAAAIFNREEKLKFTLDYEYDSLDGIIDRLVDGGVNIPFSFGVQAGLVGGKELTLTFTHPNEPSKATDSDTPYVQRASASYLPITPSRATDFDAFKINGSAVSYPVSTSEQLYYALECRVKPLPVAGSAAERIYEKIKTVLRDIITDEMNDFEKTRAIYDYLIMNVIYDGELYELLTGSTELDSTDYNGFYLEGVFDDGVAVCDGISKAFTAMANIEGIPCVQVSGRQTLNPMGVGHAWNKIYLDGSWYIVDATSGGTVVNGEYEVHSLCFFLITDAEMEKKYIGENHTELECNSEYDPFKSHFFTYLGTEYDLYIESQSELDILMRYFSSFDADGITVQFKIADSFDIGESPVDELQAACVVAGKPCTGRLSDGENGEIVTVW